ncbi:RNA polymerase subunit sigma-70 [Sinomicrobium soli]|nr:RNA polymerase subunit sigma-70 [Sinomicrobium sp. N-1-3-6]
MGSPVYLCRENFGKTGRKRSLVATSPVRSDIDYRTILYLYHRFQNTNTLEITAEFIQKNIDRARKGDQKAFNFLLDHYWNDIYGFQLIRTKNENDAEDITIQTFSRAFDRIATFDNSYSFKTWLITISKNIHLDLLRKRKSSLFHSTSQEDDTVYDVPDDTPSAEDNLIYEQNLAQLKRFIKKLKPHYQDVINMRYFRELSYQEIAAELDEPLNNVKVKLLRAKKLLAEIIHKSKNV